ncbi:MULTISPECIES: heavy metal-binding domain-containing protein [unclassified Cryobacterium]|uniref:heavy metal-binding domain-containing protein n=1 Tax=unclassified Cryobacterium TaxID=2649013 RepID=UPI002AB46FED|nr:MULTISPECIES: heavy metal-binding domain-containing protein [unclassified Cryobacterium]MDY7543917.1 heavy metal-binding domain-containing protein [Cryobacterium sp. 5B3]MEA9997648.1 heavy metal-binding domain-containing protein [Cryobacterium sp. RTS3]MEB0264504.1 heavy metal-binding domain-containing protein [Cryobacterium sp. 10I5]MEB0273629.1 heavy metal-binding domain-containing protein [Cryobacterium sp. 5B3]
MDEWTGGLPPAAHARIAAQRASRTSGSLLSVAAAASLQSVGLTAVGEVFGCAVMNLGWRGSGCAWWTSGTNMRTSSIGQVSPVTTSGGGSTWGSFAPYVGAYERGWYGALKRMRVEAQALGAHGVVDIRIHRTRVEGTAWEFSALGTAVRSTDSSHLPFPAADADPWYTNLSGEDCAAALLAGYLPHSVVLGMSVSTKHEDWQLQQQRTSWINGEVTGMTRLVQAARREARERLARRVTHTGAADLVVTGTTLSEFDTACGGSDARDLHAEFVIVGTTLVALPRANRRPAAPPPLTVMPLRDPKHRPRTPEH